MTSINAKKLKTKRVKNTKTQEDREKIVSEAISKLQEVHLIGTDDD